MELKSFFFMIDFRRPIEPPETSESCVARPPRDARRVVIATGRLRLGENLINVLVQN
jgi:hypothetical protein